MPTIFQANQLATRADCWHDEATVLTGNPLTFGTNTNQAFNLVAWQNPAANGGSFSHSVFLKAGTYTFSVLGAMFTDKGMVDWYLDGVAFVTGQDWYNAVVAYNTVKTASVVISTDGYHVLKGVVNGKNASSSGYDLGLTKYWFKQATD